ncbi:MAG: hypothetical protein IPM13_13595 [Phycisphaerales bacterium]|nr:hypothetical protein [Phycisphaerales bacterium]
MSHRKVNHKASGSLIAKALGAVTARDAAGRAVAAAVAVTLAALMVTPATLGTPYWYAWEGDDWPENQGWTRVHGPNGAQATRTLASGQMTIDGLSPPVYDGYRISPYSNYDINGSEAFIMRWRVRVDQIDGPYPWDPSVAVVSHQLRMVSLIYGYDRVRSALAAR